MPNITEQKKHTKKLMAYVKRAMSRGIKMQDAIDAALKKYPRTA